MEKINIRQWNVVEHLKTDKDMEAYLEAALEEGDSTLIAAALDDIAHAKGMTKIEGLGRENFYKALSLEDNDADFSTIFKVIQALGFRLHATTVRA